MQKTKAVFYLTRFAGDGAERKILNILNHINQEQDHRDPLIGRYKNNHYFKFFNSNMKAIKLICGRSRYALIKIRSNVSKYFKIKKHSLTRTLFSACLNTIQTLKLAFDSTGSRT